MKRVLLICLVISTLTGCGLQSNEKSPTVEEKVNSVSDNEAVSDNEVVEDYEGYTSASDGPVQFKVGGSNDVEDEIPIEEVPNDAIVVNDNWSVGSCVLYEVKSAKLNLDTVRDGYAFYTWVQNDIVVPTTLTIEEDGYVGNAEDLLKSLGDEEYKMNNQCQLQDVTVLSSPVGEGKIYRYSSDVDGAHFVSYVKMKNGKLCTIKMDGEVEFDKAVAVVNDIHTNGLTVILTEGVSEVVTEEPAE